MTQHLEASRGGFRPLVRDPRASLGLERRFGFGFGFRVPLKGTARVPLRDL